MPKAGAIIAKRFLCLTIFSNKPVTNKDVKREMPYYSTGQGVSSLIISSLRIIIYIEKAAYNP